MDRGGHVATRNYELDSLCYFLDLSYKYWTKARTYLSRVPVFDDEWVGTVKTIVDLFVVEQNHEQRSPYRYVELSRGGLGSRTNFTGMTWTGFRPSDDPCKFHYLVPANAFVYTTLGYALEMLSQIQFTVAKDIMDPLVEKTKKLREEVQNGIQTHGIKEFPGFGRVYAFEVDGLGGVNFMDDANVPSLLSLKYLNYKNPSDPNDELIRATRRFVLSTHNPYFHQGGSFKGIGSPHTPHGNIWPMSLIVQAMTSDDPVEVVAMLRALIDSDAGTGMMHESFNPNNPHVFTRHWFAWANSLFAELVEKVYGNGQQCVNFNLQGPVVSPPK